MLFPILTLPILFYLSPDTDKNLISVWRCESISPRIHVYTKRRHGKSEEEKDKFYITRGKVKNLSLQIHSPTSN